MEYRERWEGNNATGPSRIAHIDQMEQTGKTVGAGCADACGTEEGLLLLQEDAEE